jgi:asparagine synthase (glutamine-hydrolysing)
MCGICGILNTDGRAGEEAVLRSMTAAIAHRGPDGEGFHLRGPVGLGHRRLAIIDPECGAQPMGNEDGSVWITYNGEIYNFKEIRAELETRGHVFRTRSDTEMVAHAYEEWGADCLRRFRGMFAFAIADHRRRELFLARDPLGIKPLFYFYEKSTFAFASELQALRTLPGIEWRIDLQAVDQYLYLQYIPAPRTVFQNGYKLRPGHYLTVPFAGPPAAPVRYWRLRFQPVVRREADLLDELDQVLRRSVEMHLVADVPFGAFLSGGIDSSAVVGYMAQSLRRPVKTFSIGFEDSELNELPYARQAAARWKTEHHEEIVRADGLAILPQLVKHYGEPFGDASAVPTYYVSRMAREHVPMVLSGDGGDEAFGGYNTYRQWLRWLGKAGMAAWKRPLFPIASSLFPKRWPRREPLLENWLGFMQYIGPDWRRRLWRPEFRSACGGPPEALSEAFAETAGYDPLQSVQYMDMMTYLPFAILTKVDVASMMNSLEVRTPIVDIRVMEYAATIPSVEKMAASGPGRFEGKLVFKKLLRKYFPESFLQRPKQGFGIPMRRWFGGEGETFAAARERLLHARSTLHGWFDPKALAALVDGKNTGAIWLLLFLEEWLRQETHGR